MYLLISRIQCKTTFLLTGGTIPPSSKTKKEATNKTKKEEVSRKVSLEKNKKEAAIAAAAAAAASTMASEAPTLPEPAEDIPEQEVAGPRKMSAVLTGKYTMYAWIDLVF